MENEATIQSEEKYILGKDVKGYDSFCPITQINVYPMGDGKYRGGDPNHEQIFEETQFIQEPGFLILLIRGSFWSNDHTVQTAAFALNDSLIHLFSPCDITVDFIAVRTTVELKDLFISRGLLYSHVILVGHGIADGIPFLDREDPVSANELAELITVSGESSHTQVISLCCHSGSERIASILSKQSKITEVIAPNGPFVVSWAVHFVTGYLLRLFNDGHSLEDAVQGAVSNPESTPMCIWRDGAVIHDCKSK